MRIIKINYSVLSIVMLTFNFLNSQDLSWSQKSDFQGSERPWSVSFSIGDKGYLGTGGANGINSNDFWEYNPETDIWTQKANVGGEARTGAVGLSIGNKGYVGLGRSNSGIRNDFWEYNPDSNTWSQKALYPGQGMSQAVAFSIEDKGYVGTGTPTTQIGNATNEFWEYNPNTNNWSQKSNFGGGVRTRAVGFSIGQKGFIGTGYHFNGTTPISYNDFWEYDPVADIWTEKSQYPGLGKVDCAGFSIGPNHAYIGMGTPNNTDFWQYDLSTDSWSQILFFEGQGRYGLTSFSVNNKGFVSMGYSVDASGTTNYTDFWELQDATLSVNSNEFIEGIKIDVFPNPATDLINIILKNQNIDFKEYIIYDIQGKEQIRSNNESINIKALATGVYFIKINTTKGDFTKRFIKK